MQTQDQVQSRNSQASVVDRRRVDGILSPFIGQIKGWNGQAARLRALAVSPYSSQEDRSLARLQCGALLAEIRHRQRDLNSAIKGEPPHSRLDDVAAAFQRLIDQLEQVSRGA